MAYDATPPLSAATLLEKVELEIRTVLDPIATGAWTYVRLRLLNTESRMVRFTLWSTSSAEYGGVGSDRFVC